MPQFEIETAAAPGPSAGPPALTRGRTPEEAFRQAAGVPDTAALELDPADREGWHVARVDGVEAGRVRPHQRMRFRRD